MLDFIDDINEALKSPLEVKNLWLINSDFYPKFNKSPIHSLPNDIAQCKNLEYLRIEGHPIKYLPEGITNLEKLTRLSIYNTKLKSLPIGITKMTQLKFLRLSCNELDVIPENIGDLENLKYLFLDGNNITSLPKSLYRILKSCYFNINYNKFDDKTLKNVKNDLAKMFNIIEGDIEPVIKMWSDKYPLSDYIYERDDYFDATSVRIFKRKENDKFISYRDNSCSVCGAIYGDGCLLSDFQNCKRY